MVSFVQSMPARSGSTMQEESSRGVHVCVRLLDGGRDSPACPGGQFYAVVASSHLFEHPTSGNRGTSTHAQNARLRSVSLISSPCTDLNHCLQVRAALAEQRAGGGERCRQQALLAEAALSQQQHSPSLWRQAKPAPKRACTACCVCGFSIPSKRRQALLACLLKGFAVLLQAAAL